MIRITLKGNPDPLEETMKMKMKMYLMFMIICEKILSLREGFCGLLVRSQGVAMLTHLQRSCSLPHPYAQHRRSAVHRVAGSRSTRRVCTLRTPWLAQTARRFGLVHPLSTHSAHWGWRCTQLLHSHVEENKKCGGVKNKGS